MINTPIPAAEIARLSDAISAVDIAKLPNSSHLRAEVAAKILDTSPAVLANWRSQRRGPNLVNKGRIIRYLVGDLRKFLTPVATRHTA